MSDYQFSLYTPQGKLSTILDIEAADIARRLNEIGAATVSLDPERYDYRQMQRDMVLLIERSIGSTTQVVGDTIWFLRGRKLHLPQPGEEPDRLTLTFQDANTILRRRIVAYFATEAQADKLDQTDDMILAIIRENFGSGAIAARNISSFLSVQPDLSLGPSIEKQFAWQDVLRVIQDIARTSDQLGTKLYFDIVLVRPPIPIEDIPTYRLEFRTFKGQRGIDHRFPDGNPAILIGPDFGNLTDVTLEDDWMEEETHIYAGGEGEDLLRLIAEAADTALESVSPIGRIEGWFDARDIDVAADLATEARSTLLHRVTRTAITGEFVESTNVRWGVDIGYGDLVTVQVREKRFDCLIDVERYVIARDAKERIGVSLKGLASGN